MHQDEDRISARSMSAILNPEGVAPDEMEALRLELIAAVERLLQLVSTRVAEIELEEIEPAGNA
ncbi:MAG: hypothetical protein P0Y66_22045 [Candidatus Kaistia colombiensis]|nr:MAG: hypothetical protein P0Y66_22045 [Kaistia sp.]